MDCTPHPNQETENVNHEEFEAAHQRGAVILLEDVVRPAGRYQTMANVKGGDIILSVWHSPKQDGDWHQCDGAILTKGWLPKLRAFLTEKGYSEFA